MATKRRSGRSGRVTTLWRASPQRPGTQLGRSGCSGRPRDGLEGLPSVFRAQQRRLGPRPPRSIPAAFGRRSTWSCQTAGEALAAPAGESSGRAAEGFQLRPPSSLTRTRSAGVASRGGDEEPPRELRKGSDRLFSEERPVDGPVADEEEPLRGADRHGEMVDGPCPELRGGQESHGESMYPPEWLRVGFSPEAVSEALSWRDGLLRRGDRRGGRPARPQARFPYRERADRPGGRA